MPRGRIKALIKNFGFIKQHDKGEDVFFHARSVKGIEFHDLKEGMAVEFDVVQREKGLQATSVRLLDEQAKYSPDYRFLNPYNFVRFLDKGQEVKETRLLGRCPPPPHDRYVGITGRIACTLKTITPLFISDSEGTCKEPNNHKTYRFFKVNNQYAIPSTALRGMVRNVFEAVTNSCFSNISERQLDYRMSPTQANKYLKPAIVIKLPNPAEKDDGEVWLLESAPVPRSEIEKASKTVLASHVCVARLPQEKTFDSYLHIVLKDQNLPIQAKINGNRLETILATGRSTGQLEQDLQLPDGDKFWGFLKITGPNVFAEESRHGHTITRIRKDDERFFYWDGSEKRKAKIPYEDVKGRYNAAQRYNEVRKAQKGSSNRQLPYVTYLQNESLSVGDLVWVVLAEDGTNVVTDIGSVSIPKLRYKHRILDLLPEYLHVCLDYSGLCPACRVFGWVYQAKEKEKFDPNIRVAYAGRVNFLHGILQGKAKKIDETIPLAILSSPNPTTTYFYLLNSSGDPDFCVNYNKLSAQLRGRKFYRHHGTANPQEYTRATDEKHDGRDDQNRTVVDVLDKDNEFIFNVQFENLAPMELGALLWSLELLDGKKRLAHRLGFAKPLGFGSVEIEVNDVEVLDPRARYSSLEKDGWHSVKRIDWEKKCVQIFKKAMEMRYEKSFDDLPNIQDLKALLSEPHLEHIHYPRPPFKKKINSKDKYLPDPEGKQYEWFVGNKKKRYTLKLAPEDKKGFPIMDKKGKEY